MDVECTENDHAWLALLPIFTGNVIGILLSLGIVYSTHMDTRGSKGAGVALVIVGIFWEIALGFVVLYYATMYPKSLDPFEPYNEDSDDGIPMVTRDNVEDTLSSASDEEPLPLDPEEAKAEKKARRKKNMDRTKRHLKRKAEKAMASDEVRLASKGCKQFMVELSKLIPSVIGSFMFMLGVALATEMKTNGNDVAGSSLLASAFCMICLLILIKILNKKAAKIRNRLGWI